VKPWQHIVGVRPNGSDRSHPAGAADEAGDSRSAFDELRQSLEGELRREPGSPLLHRSSLETLLGAFVTRAQQGRGAVGLIAFELEDWKSLEERAGASAFASAFADLAVELRRRVRESDDLGRLGEAQIAAILPGCEQQMLGSVSERLRLAVEACEFSFGQQSIRPSLVTAWLSAPAFPTSTSPGHLLEQLTSALEQARASAPGSAR
jgi:GGDEF domain-containing protein